jgi:streptomycin 3"-adenylyltransferase
VALIGVYLHGSAVQGGLRPTSDLDVLAIVERPTTDDERRAIVHGLAEISGRRATRGPARPVELTVVQQSQLKPWRFPPIVDLLYGEWLRDELTTGDIPAPRPMPDLAPEVYLALLGNRALFGPAPAEVIDPVPAADLRRSIVAGVPGLLADLEGDTRNVLLTLARIVATLETGEILPKDEAVDLAAHLLPAGSTREVLLVAREMYVEGVDDEVAGPTWAAARPAAWEAATALVEAIAGFEVG